ncbi:MAG: cytochrome c3 family protein [Coriobacteriales bacterium]|jgi:hypothetical protein|nr:cytochrome c3 family protein [Coriobacteriales bacterium]
MNDEEEIPNRVFVERFTEKNGKGGESGPGNGSKRRPRRWIVVLCVVGVLIVGLGIGAFVWHEHPSFCGTICHVPMASYVEGYNSGDTALGVTAHQRAGKDCLDCHEPSIDQQLQEGLHWVAGDYTYDEKSRQLPSQSASMATAQSCLKSGCHVVETLEQLEQTTATMPRNVHDFSVHGVTDCGSCHQMHEQSTIVCSECHREATEQVPEGWTFIPYGS